MMKNCIRFCIFLWMLGSCISSPRYDYAITEPPEFVPDDDLRKRFEWFTMRVKNDCTAINSIELRLDMYGYFVLDPRQQYWYRTLMLKKDVRKQSLILPAEDWLHMRAFLFLPEDWLFSSHSLDTPKLYYSKDSEPELIIDCSGPDDVQLQYIGPDGKTYPNDEPREREEYRIAPIGP